MKFWDTARRRLGDAAGTRALCDVLLLHRTHAAGHVLVGITAALSVGAVDPAVVAIETRRAIEHQPAASTAITERLPDLAGYDRLLTESHPE